MLIWSLNLWFVVSVVFVFLLLGQNVFLIYSQENLNKNVQINE